jgi:hypothetical protein
MCIYIYKQTLVFLKNEIFREIFSLKRSRRLIRSGVGTFAI